MQIQVQDLGKNARASRKMSGLEACQVGLDLASIGKRWTFDILQDIGVLHIDRFNQILRSIPGLTPRVLIMRLSELEKRGLIRSVTIQARPRKVRWELTEKGNDTLPIVQGYISYARKWYPNASLKNHLPDKLGRPSLQELVMMASREQGSRRPNGKRG